MFFGELLVVEICYDLFLPTAIAASSGATLILPPPLAGKFGKLTLDFFADVFY